jgi:hypothetical protein
MEIKENIDNLYMKVKTTLGFYENFEFLFYQASIPCGKFTNFEKK